MPYYHILLRGKVQGVGMRYFIYRNAVSHHIAGWVRNNPDGTVELEAQGSETDLDGFVSSIRNGNRYAVIESLDIDRRAGGNDWTSFRIV